MEGFRRVSRLKPDVAQAIEQARVDSHPVVDVPRAAVEVAFRFDGRPLTGRSGEMLSSALIANGVMVFGRHPRDGSAQGIFCANGQCAQCLVLADGKSVKACVTRLRSGMEVRSLSGAPELPPDDVPREVRPRLDRRSVDLLVVGGGPAGLAAALELSGHGLQTILCDDKPTLGGKLTLQTHNFFGSAKDCYAGQRGKDIGALLEREVRSRPDIEVWTEAPVVGVFEDGWLGVLREGRFTLVQPRSLLIATGARERALAFPGSDLPGVYGAGAFQTLVNRDLVKPARRLLIVGGGNVGLIVAYQALQAGVEVAAVVELLPECGGYKVHRDKLLRLGVPVLTSHSVLSAEGTERVERAIIAQVDDRLRPVEGTAEVLEVDTILLAVGLSPVNELVEEGRRLGVRVYSAGDAQEIAEASAAIFSGKLTARRMLRDLGMAVEVPEDWQELRATLASHPGPVLGAYPLASGQTVYPVIRCEQEIPCNPCTEVCVRDSLKIPEGTIVGRPRLVGDCVGCLKCLAVCPGLAITLVDRRVEPTGQRAKVTVPWEMPEGTVRAGDEVVTSGREGEPVGLGHVVRILSGRALNRRRLVVLEVPASEADQVAGIRPRPPERRARAEERSGGPAPRTVICRCERVTREAISEYLATSRSRDLNAVKAALRAGMGPCGGRTCTELVLRVFRESGIDPKTVAPAVHRPFTQEVPLNAFLEDDGREP